MRTKKMLEQLPSIHREYLENLRTAIQSAKDVSRPNLAESYKSVGRGYIKCLVDCGVVDSFKTVWCWFTL